VFIYSGAGNKIERRPAPSLSPARRMSNIISSIKSCFGEESVQNVRIEGDKIFIAITEDGNNWWKNCCVLQDWYFDYEKFKTLDMHIDCESYGVYVFWPKKPVAEK
jgi:hypothetical protein